MFYVLCSAWDLLLLRLHTLCRSTHSPMFDNAAQCSPGWRCHMIKFSHWVCREPADRKLRVGVATGEKETRPRSLSLQLCSARTRQSGCGCAPSQGLPFKVQTCKSWSGCGKARRGELVCAHQAISLCGVASYVIGPPMANAARHRHSRSSSSPALPFPLGRQFQVCQESIAWHLSDTSAT